MLEFQVISSLTVSERIVQVYGKTASSRAIGEIIALSQVNMRVYLLLMFLCVFAHSVYAGLGGSFSDTLDEDTDDGIHPECQHIKTDAYIAHTNGT